MTVCDTNVNPLHTRFGYIRKADFASNVMARVSTTLYHQLDKCVLWKSALEGRMSLIANINEVIGVLPALIRRSAFQWLPTAL